MLIDKIEAILKLYPSVATIRGDVAYDVEENVVVYDEAAIQSYIDAHQYKQQRALEYPPLAEQLDMLYHDRINNTDTWMEAIQAVKNKYPKS